MSASPSTVFADLFLSRRLERAEAQSSIDFLEARAVASPERGALWQQFGGAFAMYDGVTSPLTQSFCLGLFEPISSEILTQLETFFSERGAPVFHEVSPLIDVDAASLLGDCGYRPIEFTNVLFRPIRVGQHYAELRDPRIIARMTDPREQEVWAQTAARGWSEFKGLAEFLKELAPVNANRKNGFTFLAELNGKPIAAGALAVHEGVAVLAGASTVPEGRKQGAQLALLDARLRYGAEHGCDLAMMCALPGSASQRNAERQGFRIAYTRIKWQLVTKV